MTTSASPRVAPSTDGIDRSSSTANALRSLIGQVAGNARADVAFGTPQVIGQRTLIPVARVIYGYGAGNGDSTKQQGGAGGGLAVRPFAVVEVTQDQVRIVPIVDVQTMISR